MRSRERLARPLPLVDWRRGDVNHRGRGAGRVGRVRLCVSMLLVIILLQMTIFLCFQMYAPDYQEEASFRGAISGFSGRSDGGLDFSVRGQLSHSTPGLTRARQDITAAASVGGLPGDVVQRKQFRRVRPKAANDLERLSETEPGLILTPLSYKSYEVRLSREPNSDVAVMIEGDKAPRVSHALYKKCQVKVMPTGIVFTPLNWQSGRIINVEEPDEALCTDVEPSLIHTIYSTDALFDGLHVKMRTSHGLLLKKKGSSKYAHRKEIRDAARPSIAPTSAFAIRSKILLGGDSLIVDADSGQALLEQVPAPTVSMLSKVETPIVIMPEAEDNHEREEVQQQEQQHYQQRQEQVNGNQEDPVQLPADLSSEANDVVSINGPSFDDELIIDVEDDDVDIGAELSLDQEVLVERQGFQDATDAASDAVHVQSSENGGESGDGSTRNTQILTPQPIPDNYPPLSQVSLLSMLKLEDMKVDLAPVLKRYNCSETKKLNKALRCILAGSTDYRTLFYIVSSPKLQKDLMKPAPLAMVLGGTHGRELAGFEAAGIIKSWVPKHGRLVVVDRVNRRGIERHTRYVPASEPRDTRQDDEKKTFGPDDLNRDFPADPHESPETPLAKALWSLVDLVRPMLFLDLHEGWGFHGELIHSSKAATPDLLVKNPNFSKGSSVICSMNAIPLAKIMADTVNKHIREKPRKFEVLNPPIEGGLARRVHNAFGTRSFVLETTQQSQALEKRVTQHLQMVAAVFKKLGLISGDFRATIPRDKQKAFQRVAADAKHGRISKAGLESTKSSKSSSSSKKRHK